MRFLTCCFFLGFVFKNIDSQSTIGLLQYGNGNYPGYVLFNPINSTNTYLIDKCGYEVRSWQSSFPSGLAAYLTSDGSMVRAGKLNNTTFNAGGAGGVIEKWGFTGNFLWSYQISSTTECQHHDIRALPNGNILALVWEKETIALAIANGRAPANLAANIWIEKIVELHQTGVNTASVIWEWRAWDHLIQDFDSTKLNYGVVANHPELLNFNYLNGPAVADWMHCNGLDYDSIHDQIIFSSRQLCEVYVIDHSTTTAQAASHLGGDYGKGGDFLYRWGNPEAYNRGVLADRKLFFQHCPRWIPNGYPNAGKISIFNNGNNRPAGNYSTVDYFSPPTTTNWEYNLTGALPFGPSSMQWSYADSIPTNFFDNAISGTTEMKNGNFIVTDGMNGIIFEIDSNKNKLWTYQNPVNALGPATQGTIISGSNIFNASFYEPTFIGFAGQNLVSGAPIELNPLAYSCNMPNGIDLDLLEEKISVFPNPTQNEIFVEHFSGNEISCRVVDILGKELFSTNGKDQKIKIDISQLQKGIYFLQINSNGKTLLKKVVKD